MRVGVGEGVGLLVPVETGVGVALEAGPCHIQVATGCNVDSHLGTKFDN